MLTDETWVEEVKAKVFMTSKEVNLDLESFQASDLYQGLHMYELFK